jgi:hypothetical protein
MLSAVLSPGAFGSAAQPHFDFRFHTGDRARVEAIAPGRCGELVDCGDFKVATRTVPARYLPSGYIDVGAVVPRMGNHLLDSQSPSSRIHFRSPTPSSTVPAMAR